MTEPTSPRHDAPPGGRPQPPTAITLPASVRSRLLAWAASREPREACGLLLGDPATAEVTDAVELPNLAPRGRFLLDPRALITAEEAARARGQAVLGPWHSHPAGDTRPSPADRSAAALWPGTIWLVIGREITAWTADSGGLSPLPLRPTGRGAVLQSAAR